MFTSSSICFRYYFAMSGPVDLSLVISALIWYFSGYKTNIALLWFFITYIIGHAIADNGVDQSCFSGSYQF